MSVEFALVNRPFEGLVELSHFYIFLGAWTESQCVAEVSASLECSTSRREKTSRRAIELHVRKKA